MRLLQGYQDARFEVVAQELRRNWIQQISDLLQRLDAPVILLGLKVLQHQDEDPVEREAVTVTRQMLKAVRAFAADCVEVSTYVSGQSDELEDMLFGTLQQPMAEHMIGPAAHKTIADALVAPVRNLH